MRLWPLLFLIACASSSRLDELQAAQVELSESHAALEARVAELEEALEALQRRERRAEAVAERRERLAEDAGRPREPRGRAWQDAQDEGELRAAIDRIEALEDGHFRVPPDVREALMAERDVLYRHTRFIPSLSDGEPVGMGLYAVRPNSAPGRLGLRNGDVVRRVNDQALDVDVTEFLPPLVEILQSAERIEVEVRRRGQPVMLVWEVR